MRGRADVWDTDYDLLFDGFPRSGSTFGHLMILMSKEKPLRIRTHTHHPTVFVRAIQRNRPACLCLRPPADAIVSWAIYMNRSFESALQYYINFHAVLLPLAAQLLVLPFPTIIEDFPTVLALLNLRFGMDVRMPSNPDMCKRVVFDEIDRLWRKEDPDSFEKKVARPNQKRDEGKLAAHQELQQERYRPLLQECTRLYQDFESHHQRDLEKLNRTRSPGSTFIP